MSDKIEGSTLKLPLLGKKGDSRAPILDYLENLRTPISPNYISRLRGGNTSGRCLSERLLDVEILTTDDASNKDDLYFRMASIAMDQRRFRGGDLGHRYSKRFYTEDVASILGISPQNLRKAFRVMRAELVYQEEEEQQRGEENTTRVFQPSVDEYIQKSITPPSVAIRFALELQSRWQPRTVARFYQLLYDSRLGDIKTIGSFLSYEVEAFWKFYQDRNKLYNPLTYFDRMVLESHLAQPQDQPRRLRKSDHNLAIEIRGHTGIKIDAVVLGLHRNALISGNL